MSPRQPNDAPTENSDSDLMTVGVQTHSRNHHQSVDRFGLHQQTNKQEIFVNNPNAHHYYHHHHHHQTNSNNIHYQHLNAQQQGSNNNSEIIPQQHYALDGGQKKTYGTEIRQSGLEAVQTALITPLVTVDGKPTSGVEELDPVASSLHVNYTSAFEDQPQAYRVAPPLFFTSMSQIHSLPAPVSHDSIQYLPSYNTLPRSSHHREQEPHQNQSYPQHRQPYNHQFYDVQSQSPKGRLNGNPSMNEDHFSAENSPDLHGDSFSSSVERQSHSLRDSLPTRMDEFLPHETPHSTLPFATRKRRDSNGPTPYSKQSHTTAPSTKPPVHPYSRHSYAMFSQPDRAPDTRFLLVIRQQPGTCRATGFGAEQMNMRPIDPPVVAQLGIQTSSGEIDFNLSNLGNLSALVAHAALLHEDGETELPFVEVPRYTFPLSLMSGPHHQEGTQKMPVFRSWSADALIMGPVKGNMSTERIMPVDYPGSHIKPRNQKDLARLHSQMLASMQASSSDNPKSASLEPEIQKAPLDTNMDEVAADSPHHTTPTPKPPSANLSRGLSEPQETSQNSSIPIPSPSVGSAPEDHTADEEEVTGATTLLALAGGSASFHNSNLASSGIPQQLHLHHRHHQHHHDQPQHQNNHHLHDRWKHIYNAESGKHRGRHGSTSDGGVGVVVKMGPDTDTDNSGNGTTPPTRDGNGNSSDSPGGEGYGSGSGNGNGSGSGSREEGGDDGSNGENSGDNSGGGSGSGIIKAGLKRKRNLLEAAEISSGGDSGLGGGNMSDERVATEAATAAVGAHEIASDTTARLSSKRAAEAAAAAAAAAATTSSAQMVRITVGDSPGETETEEEPASNGNGAGSGSDDTISGPLYPMSDLEKSHDIRHHPHEHHHAHKNHSIHHDGSHQPSQFHQTHHHHHHHHHLQQHGQNHSFSGRQLHRLGPADGQPIPTPTNRSQRWERTLCGTLVTSGQLLTDLSGQKGAYFVFSDMSVRVEGVFRLKLTVSNLASVMNPVIVHNDGESVGKAAEELASAITSPFKSLGIKGWNGAQESSDLSKHFADQGIKMPIRRKSRKKGDDLD